MLTSLNMPYMHVVTGPTGLQPASYIVSVTDRVPHDYCSDHEWLYSPLTSYQLPMLDVDISVQ
jgi:hypothetical protein